MLRFRSFIFLGSLSSLLGGCGGGEAPVESAIVPPLVAPAVVPPQKKSPGSDFRAEVVPSDRPNQYVVTLKWETIGSGRCLVEREDVRRRERMTLGELDCALATYKDDGVQAGRRYQYRLRVLDIGGTVLDVTTEVAIPRDLVVRGDQWVPSLDGIHRLFLLEKAHVRTGGMPWRGELEELVVDDATLEVFAPVAMKSTPGTDARSAGSITLRVRRARGNLILNLIGQGANDGAPGAPGTAGKDGKDGRRAEIDVDPQYYVNLPNLLQLRPDHLKAAWEGTPIGQNAGNWMKCVTPGTSGEDGAPGTAGAAGTRGGNGGNSPRTLLVVEDGENFRIAQPKYEGGDAGGGGVGGLGGAGGKGGAAGATDKTGVCPATTAGKNGADGAQGPAGKNGTAGKTEPLCVVIAGSRTGDCDSFADELAR